jgi:regulator of nucleoside diphosphate kinase
LFFPVIIAYRRGREFSGADSSKVNMTTMNRTIYITQADMTRLRSLIESLKTSREDIKDLRAELDQASIVAPADIPPDVITMNSKAQLRDLADHEIMTYTLVFPAKANADDGLISVLAPIGTAMLGHQVGDEFEWNVPGGTVRLRVESVLYQPEAAGHYHL